MVSGGWQSSRVAGQKVAERIMAGHGSNGIPGQWDDGVKDGCVKKG